LLLASGLARWWGLPGGGSAAGDEGDDDVRGVAVEVLASAVVHRRGAGSECRAATWTSRRGTPASRAAMMMKPALIMWGCTSPSPCSTMSVGDGPKMNSSSITGEGSPDRSRSHSCERCAAPAASGGSRSGLCVAATAGASRPRGPTRASNSSHSTHTGTDTCIRASSRPAPTLTTSVSRARPECSARGW
jgi:hypothetical protein